ncbi:MAG: hypothetical protein NT010_02345 [Proteobacteria bacterium]|nr:hypothetical protein [Pseudomonadota bacterium]
MKKKMSATLIVILGISFILPTASFAWRGVDGPGIGYHGAWGPHNPHRWYHPRVYIGTSFVSPWYFFPPPYVYPPTVVYVNPVPRPAYAYPDPELSGQNVAENPPGQWVTVPGQWIDGKWIPSHKAWVAVNP